MQGWVADEIRQSALVLVHGRDLQQQKQQQQGLQRLKQGVEAEIGRCQMQGLQEV
jgi:hypothetical protein